MILIKLICLSVLAVLLLIPNMIIGAICGAKEIWRDYCNIFWDEITESNEKPDVREKSK